MIPMESVLGVLSLFPAGDMGTIPSSQLPVTRQSKIHLQKGTTQMLSVKAQGSGDSYQQWHLDVFAVTLSQLLHFRNFHN